MLVALFCAPGLQAQRLSAKYLAYVDQYKEVAVRHQQEFGIPASITLAQGLLESMAGQSRLATQGNNHFGIKCHNTWHGDTVRSDDSLQDCYRKYGAAEDSFLDHARFLKGKRYAKLYDLEVTDYKGWANGLRDCGYATDPAYPDKLITLIERYNLQAYDSGQARVAGKKNLKADESLGHDANAASETDVVMRDATALRTVHERWGVRCIKAEAGDTYEDIAAEFDLKLKKLLEYNDVKKDADGVPAVGEMVYLEPKLNKATEGHDKHVVRSGDTLRSISQAYGVRLKSILKMNGLKEKSVLAEDDEVRLR